MQIRTLRQIQALATDAKSQLWEDAQSKGREPKIYLHWTAGHYGQPYDDYHINIDEDGTIYTSTDYFADVLAHTWRRNTGAIGIAIDGCYGATSYDLGNEPPTEAQINTMAQVVAVLCAVLEIPCDIYHVMTHGEAADNEDGYCGAYDYDECYGPKSDCERWDLEYLGTEDSPDFDPQGDCRGGDVLRDKANWYLAQAV